MHRTFVQDLIVKYSKLERVKTVLRHAMREKDLMEVRFRFDFEGTKVVIQN
jgi:hypothetical protein